MIRVESRWIALYLRSDIALLVSYIAPLYYFSISGDQQHSHDVFEVLHRANPINTATLLIPLCNLSSMILKL